MNKFLSQLKAAVDIAIMMEEQEAIPRLLDADSAVIGDFHIIRAYRSRKADFCVMNVKPEPKKPEPLNV